MSDTLPAISHQIWDQKYRFKQFDGTPIDMTIEDTWRRVAKALASVEQDNDQAHWEHRFFEVMNNGYFSPAGRIISGAGTGRNVTLLNCFVMGTIPDSMAGIFSAIKEAALTMQQGGGIGYDFSTIRPRGAEVKGVAADASGPLSFMDVWDAMCRTVMSAGSRRGAMMATMRCDHPDIEAFIEAKRDPAKLRMFNLSVLVTDAFMDAVKNDQPWRLHFENRRGETLVERTIQARDLWKKIMRNTYDFAEPGVIFIDRINAANNLRSIETISATNPCVPAGTPILTKKGWWPIDELVGRDVEVWNGVQWSPVTPSVTGHDQQLVTVKLSDGRELTCTPAHRFVLQDGTRCDASELRVGAKLISGRWPVIAGHVDYTLAYDQGFFSGDGTEKEDGQQYIYLYGEKKLLEDELAGPLSRGEYAITGGYEGTDLTQTKVYLNYGKRMFLPKNFVPSAEWDIESRLRWLEGICDSDGCACRSYNSVLVQISAKNRDFLRDILLMLNTLGVTGNLSEMKDCWRLGISASNVARLQDLGFAPKRLDLSDNNPQREAARFARVVAVEPVVEIAPKVFCFTENQRHMGCFNGVLTGQCGEQPLPPYGACLLGSINVAKLVANPFTAEAQIDTTALRSVVSVAIRMMDNVINVSGYPLEQQAEEARNKRRIGLGVTGIADALIMLGEVYGSDKAVTLTDYIMESIAVFSYAASIELAKEKGAYPLFIADQVLAEGTHASTLPKAIKTLIRRHGLRNSHLTSIAPTGTISMLAGNVSSGIEPMFALSYDRKVLQPDGSKTTERVEDYAVAQYRKFEPFAELPDYFVTAQTLSPGAHLKMQAAAQKWVDSSISKTINLPEDISFEDFQQVYLDAYDMGCKGCTTYRPNEVTGSVLSVAPEAKKVVVFTGTMENVTRAQMKEWAEADGWTVSGSIGPNTTLVVAGPGAGSKLKAATDRGIEIISCDEWLDRSGRSLKGVTSFTLNTDGIDIEALNAASIKQMEDSHSMLFSAEPALTERPTTLDAEVIKIKWPGSQHAIYLTISDVVENGRRRPFEVFINSKNMEHYAWTVALTRMISAVFRRPHDSRFVVEELKAVFDPKGGAWMEGKYVPSVLAAIGGAIETHMQNIGYIEAPADQIKAAQVAINHGVMSKEEAMQQATAPILCSTCSSSNVKFESGCFQCLDCGNSKCG